MLTYVSAIISLQTLRAHAQATNEHLEALQRSGLSNALTVKRVEHAMQTMVTKGLFWDKFNLKLTAHSEVRAQIATDYIVCYSMCR